MPPKKKTGKGGARKGAGHPEKHDDEKMYERWEKLRCKLPDSIYTLMENGVVKPHASIAAMLRALTPLLDYTFPKVPQKVIQEVTQTTTYNLKDAILEIMADDSDGGLPEATEHGSDGTEDSVHETEEGD